MTTPPTYGPLTEEFVVSRLGMWEIPTNLSHLDMVNLFGKIPNALSFEQSIINRLVTDFLESFVDYSSHECEFQVYLEENTNARTLEDLPICPIWHELRFFTGVRITKQPTLGRPAPQTFVRAGHPLRVSYNRLFLSMAITHAALP